MKPLQLSVHPVYGAIYKDGEFVQRGAVLGLSVDAKEVVVAPISGWVRIPDQAVSVLEPDLQDELCVEIWQNAGQAVVTTPGLPVHETPSPHP